MVKFRIDGDTRTLVGLGLTANNVRRLQAGDPVMIKLDKLGIESGHDKPVDVMIMVGETPAMIMQMMEEKYGLAIGEETITNIDPRMVS